MSAVDLGAFRKKREEAKAEEEKVAQSAIAKANHVPTMMGYVMKGLCDYIVELGLTPYIVIRASAEGVFVPQAHVDKQGFITLNVSPDAVSHLIMDYDHVEFNARFGGRSENIYVPAAGIVGVYAKERPNIGFQFVEEFTPTIG